MEDHTPTTKSAARTWSKAARYEGQAVFNLANGLQKNKESRKSTKRPHGVPLDSRKKVRLTSQPSDNDNSKTQTLEANDTCELFDRIQYFITYSSDFEIMARHGTLFRLYRDLKVEHDRSCETPLLSFENASKIDQEECVHKCVLKFARIIKTEFLLLFHVMNMNKSLAVEDEAANAERRSLVKQLLQECGALHRYSTDLSVLVMAYTNSARVWFHDLQKILRDLQEIGPDTIVQMNAVVTAALETVSLLRVDIPWLKLTCDRYEDRLDQYRHKIQRVMEGTLKSRDLNLDYSDPTLGHVDSYERLWERYRESFQRAQSWPDPKPEGAIRPLPLLEMRRYQCFCHHITTAEGTMRFCNAECEPSEGRGDLPVDEDRCDIPAINKTLDLWTCIGQTIATSFDEFYKVYSILCLTRMSTAFRRTWAATWNGWFHTFNLCFSGVCGFDICAESL